MEPCLVDQAGCVTACGMLQQPAVHHLSTLQTWSVSTPGAVTGSIQEGPCQYGLQVGSPQRVVCLPVCTFAATQGAAANTVRCRWPWLGAIAVHSRAVQVSVSILPWPYLTSSPILMTHHATADDRGHREEGPVGARAAGGAQASPGCLRPDRGQLRGGADREARLAAACAAGGGPEPARGPSAQVEPVCKCMHAYIIPVACPTDAPSSPGCKHSLRL